MREERKGGGEKLRFQPRRDKLNDANHGFMLVGLMISCPCGGGCEVWRRRMFNEPRCHAAKTQSRSQNAWGWRRLGTVRRSLQRGGGGLPTSQTLF